MIWNLQKSIPSCLLKVISPDLKSLLRNCRREAACGIKLNLQKTVLQIANGGKEDDANKDTQVVRCYLSDKETEKKKSCAFSTPSILKSMLYWLPFK